MANPKRHLDEVSGVEYNDSKHSSINPINEDFIGLSTGNQSRVDEAKRKKLQFNVDDTYYRLSKYHPNITKEQIYDTYVNTPMIASSKNMGNKEAVYKHTEVNGRDTNNRIMIYDNGVDRNKSNINDVISHEFGHALSHQLLNEQRAKEELDYVNSAFPKELITVPNESERQEESLQTIRQLRSTISGAHNDAIEENLDKIIDSISDDEIIDALFKTNGYTEDRTGSKRRYLKDPKGKWDSNKVKNIRNAMKFVAQNNNTTSSINDNIFV